MKRFRERRTSKEIRDKNAETFLDADNFIEPRFVVEGCGIKTPIPSLEGVSHLSIDQLIEEVQTSLNLGINKILLFGLTEKNLKDETGSYAYEEGTLVHRAAMALKQEFGNRLVVITDVCICSYTSHGHCGIWNDGVVDNDATLPVLAKMALGHARAGADFVAPSAMMDGQTAAIRNALNSEGFRNTKILAYSAKYASALYGPFRDALQSTPSSGDRKTYQMDLRNQSEALEESNADIEEGADWIMVKPALLYLDVVHAVKTKFPNTPLAAYQVSGEYMMIKAGAESGCFDADAALMESMYALKRAGADYIISYWARNAAQHLEEEKETCTNT